MAMVAKKRKKSLANPKISAIQCLSSGVPLHNRTHISRSIGGCNYFFNTKNEIILMFLHDDGIGLFIKIETDL